jgi:hypothetical protein
MFSSLPNDMDIVFSLPGFFSNQMFHQFVELLLSVYSGGFKKIAKNREDYSDTYLQLQRMP